MLRRHRFSFTGCSMSKSLPVLVGSLLLLCSCASQAPHTPAPAPAPATPIVSAAPTVRADDNLNAVAWTQTAPEHDLIYLETFRSAQSQLLAALKDKNWDA